MITITETAAKQIRLSAQQTKAEGMALRIAATRNADNSIHYGMGFDETKEEDTSVTSGDIELIIAPTSAELLKGTTLDYVELEEGKYQFIFLNPNDPEYVPPGD